MINKINSLVKKITSLILTLFMLILYVPVFPQVNAAGEVIGSSKSLGEGLAYAKTDPNHKFLVRSKDDGVNIKEAITITATVDNATKWENNYDTDFYSTISANYTANYKTENTALEIKTAAQLAAFAKFVNAGNDFSVKYVKLTDNIDLAGDVPTYTEYKVTQAVESSGANVSLHGDDNNKKYRLEISGTGLKNTWTPIGTGTSAANRFNGNFNGCGHTIQNMTVLTGQHAGLFAYHSGTIKNTNVENSTASFTNNSSNSYSGGLCGTSSGSITNCSAINCSVSSSITTTDNNSYSGGLCGRSSGSITNCSAINCSVSSSYFYSSTAFSSYSGGLCGENYTGSITNCSAINCSVSSSSSTYYAYSGGLCGSSGGSITNCSAINCSVLSFSSTYAYSGGLCSYGDSRSIINCSAINCSVSSAAASSYAFSGGLCGQNVNSSIINCSAINCSVSSTNSSSYAFSGGLCSHSNSNIRNSIATATKVHSIGLNTNVIAGGVLGRLNSGGAISKNYYDSTILPVLDNYSPDSGLWAGTATVKGNNVNVGTNNTIDVTGKTTAQLQGTSAQSLTSEEIAAGTGYGATRGTTFGAMQYEDLDNGSTPKNVWIFKNGQYPQLATAANRLERPVLTKTDNILTVNVNARQGLDKPNDLVYTWEGITGTANGSTYKLQPNDANKGITVKVTSPTTIGVAQSNAMLIKLLEPTITLEPNGFTLNEGCVEYDTNAKEFRATSDSNGKITYWYEGIDNGYASSTTPTNVGTYKVTATQAETDEYLEGSAEMNFVITEKALTVGGISIEDKVYDGDFNATIIGTPHLVGVIGNDAVSITGVGKAYFKSSAVGKHGISGPTGYNLTGAKANNYWLQERSDLTASILKKDLEINVSIKDKIYDGTNFAEFNGVPSLVGIIYGDIVNLTNGVPTFETIGNSEQDSIIPINIANFSINGADYANYNLIQPTLITAKILKGFEAIQGEHYSISTPDGANGWHKTDFRISAQPDFEVSLAPDAIGDWETDLTFSTKGEHDVTFYVKNNNGEISRQKLVSYKLDKKPTGTIDIKNNYFTTFLNWVTFGFFFKETVDVNISGEALSGIEKIEYLKVQTAYEDELEVAAVTEGWITGNKFSVTANESFVVYAKITSYAGSVTFINSDGIVIYSDSTVNTPSVSFTKLSNEDKEIFVNLNGNTIKNIFNDVYELILNTDYVIEDDMITLSSSYLQNLAAGNYTLTINFKPLGYEFIEKSEGEIPNTAIVNLNIKKANQEPITVPNLEDSYTYGNKPVVLNIAGGNGDGEISVVSDNEDVIKIIKNEGHYKMSILSAGEATITMTKAEDDNYSQANFAKRVTVNQKYVTIDKISAENKIYDGNDDAVILGGNGEIVGKLAGDDLQIDFANATSKFEDKNFGENKRVDFSGFALEGNDVSNYVLDKQPASVMANISKLGTTISGTTAKDKIYDGTTRAEINNVGLLTHKIDEDDVTVLPGNAHFVNRIVGDDKKVIFSEFFLSGIDAQNYNLISQPVNGAANITPKELTVDVVIKNKTYDGLNTAFFEENSPTLIGAIDNDNVTIKNGSGIPTFDSINIADDIEVNFTDFEIEGIDSENYYLTQPANIKANIVSGFVPEENIHYELSSPYNSQNWHGSDFKISSINSDEFLLSLENTDDGNWTNALSYNTETTIDGTDVIFYVRNIVTKEISSIKTINYKIDHSVPNGKITIGENSWTQFLNSITFGLFFKNTVTVNITATDNLSGIEKIEYYRHENALSEDDIRNLDNNAWTIGGSFDVQPDEKFVAYAKITDNAGNIEFLSSDGTIVVSTPSVINTTQNFISGNWHNVEDAKISVIVTNNMPVIKTVSYKIADKSPVSVDVVDKTNVAFDIDGFADGDYDVVIQTENELGSIVTKIISMKKDIVDPIISSISKNTSEPTNQDVALIVDASDVLSKLALEAYSFNNGQTWQASNEYYYSQNTVIPMETICVKDVAGNIVKYDKEIVIDNIDKLPPLVPAIKGVPENWVNYEVTLTVMAEDEYHTEKYSNSGIDYFEYSLDGGITFKRVLWEESQEFTITEDGDYTNQIFVKVTDKAGNVSNLSEPYTVKIDKILPIIDSVSKDNENWTNKNVVLKVEASDKLSNLAENAYSFNSGKTWQTTNEKAYSFNQTIPSQTICVKDAAGNITKYNQAITINNIDKNFPPSPIVEGASEKWSKTEVVLTVLAKDEETTEEYGSSGIDYFEYSLDGGNNFSKVMWEESQKFVVDTDGDYTNKIFVKITDKAGNTSNLSAPYTVKVAKDKAAFNQVEQITKVRAIAAEGVVPKGTTLIVEEKNPGTTAYNQVSAIIDESIKENLKNIKLYEIYLKDLNDEVIQPNGMLTIMMLIPEEFNLEKIKVYRLNEGADDKMIGTVQSIEGENYYVFDTDHLSPYALIEEKTETNEEDLNKNIKSNNEEDLNKNIKSNVDNKMETNKNSLKYYVFFLILALVIFLIIFLIIKERNKL